jgi:hypothetical protein
MFICSEGRRIVQGQRVSFAFAAGDAETTAIWMCVVYLMLLSSRHAEKLAQVDYTHLGLWVAKISRQIKSFILTN